MLPASVRQLIEMALAEDLGSTGDITTSLIEASGPIEAEVVFRESGVICGIGVVPDVLDVFAMRSAPPSRAPDFKPVAPGLDGDACGPHTRVATMSGPARDILQIERTLLNFLQRMSGVATLTRRYVEAARAANPNVQVCDTRKTIPGWRALDKYAVRSGGGTNHREGLFDAILIKDNHLALVPQTELAGALTAMLANRPAAARFVEVEVDSLDQFDVVCAVAGVDMILLDNFTPPMLREAVKRRNERGLSEKIQLEASGGVTLGTIADIAATGVERISVGAITHSAPALDIALDFREQR
jgi:nicotinate-nucleotide pyrophosphorylase (carboxylating)